jgi:hypothetical protein
MVGTVRLCLLGLGLAAHLSAQGAPKVTQEAAQRSASAGFKPASFRGIQIGKAHKADVLRAFGKPSKEWNETPDSLYLVYKDLGPFPGNVTFNTDSKSGVVLSVMVAPKDMTIRDLEEVLGKDYVVTHWSSVPCVDGGGYVLKYLDPNGGSQFIEYRRLGVTVVFDGDVVSFIDYSGIPLGYDKDPCKKKAQQKTRAKQ